MNITGAWSQSALEELAKRIILSTQSEPYINNNNLSTISAWGSVKTDKTIKDVRDEVKEYADELFANAGKLTAELTNTIPTLETATENCLYYYSTTGEAPFTQYLKINSTTLLNLGTTEVTLTKIVNNLHSETIDEALSANMGRELNDSKLDKDQGVENVGKAMVVGEDGVIIPGTEIDDEIVTTALTWSSEKIKSSLDMTKLVSPNVFFDVAVQAQVTIDNLIEKAMKWGFIQTDREFDNVLQFTPWYSNNVVLVADVWVNLYGAAIKFFGSNNKANGSENCYTIEVLDNNGISHIYYVGLGTWQSNNKINDNLSSKNTTYSSNKIEKLVFNLKYNSDVFTEASLPINTKINEDGSIYPTDDSGGIYWINNYSMEKTYRITFLCRKASDWGGGTGTYDNLIFQVGVGDSSASLPTLQTSGTKRLSYVHLAPKGSASPVENKIATFDLNKIQYYDLKVPAGKVGYCGKVNNADSDIYSVTAI